MSEFLRYTHETRNIDPPQSSGKAFLGDFEEKNEKTFLLPFPSFSGSSGKGGYPYVSSRNLTKCPTAKEDPNPIC